MENKLIGVISLGCDKNRVDVQNLGDALVRVAVFLELAAVHGEENQGVLDFLRSSTRGVGKMAEHRAFFFREFDLIANFGHFSSYC